MLVKSSADVNVVRSNDRPVGQEVGIIGSERIVCSPKAQNDSSVAALAGLLLGLAASLSGNSSAAQWLWAAGTLPVVAALLVSMVRDLLAGRVGVDAVALVAMVAALALGQGLAASVVAVMYAGEVDLITLLDEF
jgi:hypothetical protein